MSKRFARNSISGEREKGDAALFGPERFREGEVGSIVGCAVGTELPHPGQQAVVGIAANSECEMILDRLSGTSLREFAGPDESAQHMGDFSPPLGPGGRQA